MKIYKVGDKVKFKNDFPYLKASGVVTKIFDARYNNRQIVYFTDKNGNLFKSLNTNLTKVK